METNKTMETLSAVWPLLSKLDGEQRQRPPQSSVPLLPSLLPSSLRNLSPKRLQRSRERDTESTFMERCLNQSECILLRPVLLGEDMAGGAQVRMVSPASSAYLLM